LISRPSSFMVKPFPRVDISRIIFTSSLVRHSSFSKINFSGNVELKILAFLSKLAAIKSLSTSSNSSTIKFTDITTEGIKNFDVTHVHNSAGQNIEAISL